MPAEEPIYKPFRKPVLIMIIRTVNTHRIAKIHFSIPLSGVSRFVRLPSLSISTPPPVATATVFTLLLFFYFTQISQITQICLPAANG